LYCEIIINYKNLNLNNLKIIIIIIKMLLIKIINNKFELIDI